jgi:HPt (histidine-containing phosphotransfer) domain-containing protein
LRAAWVEHRAGLLAKLSLIERAVLALGSAQLDEQLRIDATHAAHMLSGSLGLFGFAHSSDAAYRLQLELEYPEPSRAPALCALVEVVQRAFDAVSSQHVRRQTLQSRLVSASPC